MIPTTPAILVGGPHDGRELRLQHWPSGGLLWRAGVSYSGCPEDWLAGREPVRFFSGDGAAAAIEPAQPPA